MYEGKNKYRGDEATLYESKRVNRLDWAREHRIIGRLCEGMPSGSRILDVPCGTGRLFPLVQLNGHELCGADISWDMLDQVPMPSRLMAGSHGLVRCEAEHLPFSDGSFDYIISLRFFHFELPIVTAQKILGEFTRVARRGIILQLSIKDHTTLGRMADLLAHVLYSRWHAPVEIAKRIKPYTFMALDRLRRKRHEPSKLRTVGSPKLPWTWTEFEEVIDLLGFTVTESHGSISPYSAKRICLIEKKRDIRDK